MLVLITVFMQFRPKFLRIVYVYKLNGSYVILSSAVAQCLNSLVCFDKETPVCPLPYSQVVLLVGKTAM